MITCCNLTTRYRPAVAVDDLTFEIPEEPVPGFRGANGAGKSTIMRLIFTLARATQSSPSAW